MTDKARTTPDPLELHEEAGVHVDAEGIEWLEFDLGEADSPAWGIVDGLRCEVCAAEPVQGVCAVGDIEGPESPAPRIACMTHVRIASA
jgi:hypothetical protein